MFSGIITSVGTIRSSEQRGDLRLAVDAGLGGVRIGDSIAVNGCCLTVVENKNDLVFELSSETLACTAPRWQKGARVNLERALALGDRLDGHFVTGHVDGIAAIKDIRPEGDSHILCLEAPAALSRYIAPKGSVTLDGVALTVNQVEGARFWVNIIPHTWKTTTLCDRKTGDALNLEVDLIARYVERLLQK